MHYNLIILKVFVLLIIYTNLMSQTENCEINKIALEYCLDEVNYKNIFLVEKKDVFYIDKYNNYYFLKEKMIKYFTTSVIDSLIIIMESIKDYNQPVVECNKKIKLISAKKSIRFMKKNRNRDLSNFKKFPFWKRTFFKITPIIYYEDYVIIQCSSMVMYLNAALRILLIQKVEGQYKVVDILYSHSS